MNEQLAQVDFFDQQIQKLQNEASTRNVAFSYKAPLDLMPLGQLGTQLIQESQTYNPQKHGPDSSIKNFDIFS